jgi:hypothetical protein
MNKTTRKALCFTAIACVLSACQQAPNASVMVNDQDAAQTAQAGAAYDPGVGNQYGVPMNDIAQTSGQPGYAQAQQQAAPQYPMAVAGQVPPDQMAQQLAYANQMAMANISPAAGPARTPDNSALLNEITELTERLQRTEKAMLRLDRRMQLVERNELNRMSGNGTGDGLGGQNAQTSFNDDAPVASPAVATVNVSSNDVGGPSYNDGFRAVSSNGGEGGAITSSLQAAPRLTPAATVAMNTSAHASGLPSIADPAPAEGKAPSGDLSIWTVKYNADKVWPDREQLPGSKDVVAALRSGQNVTLFARGKFPNAVEFRERVKAISRYLSKVTSLDSVPIAAIPAPGMDEETIEIFATH